jgi:carbamoyl-phosphate synthase large subunit
VQDQDPDAVGLRFGDSHDISEVDLVVATRDGEIANFSREEWLGSPSEETVQVCQDKVEFHDWCLENGFGTPHIYFVKPRTSQSGDKKECVWQELVRGLELSVDVFCDFESNVISSVPRLRLKTLAGESWVSKTVWNPIVMNESVRMAEKLKLVGHNVLQCFLPKKGARPVWTDVNLRFGGGSLLAIKAGCHSPKWLMELVKGRKVKPQIGKYKAGLKMLAYKEAIFEDTGDRRGGE